MQKFNSTQIVERKENSNKYVRHVSVLAVEHIFIPFNQLSPTRICFTNADVNNTIM